MKKEKSIPGPVQKAGTIPTRMGSWSTAKPVLKGKCTFCLFCWVFCPEGAIGQDEANRKVTFDFVDCKGCGICVKECPTGAIEMVEPEGDK
ncbi:MAG: 4Fe-4S binding protein [Dehalococcoidia bacterium]|nr:4Fe-4S binding protein [Dehalococcoidia bacterium]